MTPGRKLYLLPIGGSSDKLLEKQVIVCQNDELPVGEFHREQAASWPRCSRSKLLTTSSRTRKPNF